MRTLSEFLERPFPLNTVEHWVTAAVTAALVLTALWAMRSWVRRSHAKMLLTDRTELLEMPFEVLGRTTALFFFVVAICAGLSTLRTSETTANVIAGVLSLTAFVQAGLWTTTAVIGWLERRRKRALVSDRAAAGSLAIIGFVLRLLIWVIVLLLVLDNLGINITALVTGLGIGGIAIALAVQNILGDLFASLSIAFDKPFTIGDFLSVGDCLGSVEYIGVKSTRLRSLGGEQIILANADLLGSRVRNFGRMLERRIVFTTGVAYETPLEQLRELPRVIRTIVEQRENVRFDRSHLARHAASAIEFETVYYVLVADYNRYMDIQQEINFALHAALEERGVEFAYPTQKLWLARVGAGS